jgi:hypothetical protein
LFQLLDRFAVAPQKGPARNWEVQVAPQLREEVDTASVEAGTRKASTFPGRDAPDMEAVSSDVIAVPIPVVYTVSGSLMRIY